MKTKSLFIFGGLVFLLIAAGCSDSSNPYSSKQTSDPPPPNTVVIDNLSFSPATLTISTGTTITWKNNDGVAHTSTSDSGVWDTGNIPAGGNKTTTFNNAGTFSYHCEIHPSMKGTIVVN